MKLTREQNDAVKARGNVLVSAAAGSGKTAVLTQRVIDRVLNGDNPIDIDRLLVVTFTNASAAEMRKRISDALQKVIDEDKENIRAAKQKMLLESASICTTDSFCNNLVRENFTQLDIKPDFNIAASSQLALFSDSAMNEVIDGYYANDDEDYFKLLDALGADEDERRFKEAVISIFNFTRTLPYPDKWLNEIEKQYTDFSFERSIWKDIVLEECKETAEIWYLKVNSLFEEFDNFIGLGNTFDIFSYCREFFKTVNQLAENGEWDSIITACDCYSVPNIKVEKGCDEEAKERLKTEKGNIGKIVKAIKAKLIDSSGELDKQISEISPHISKLIEVVRRYSENLLKIKKEKNLFDFSDISYFALELLVDTSEDMPKKTPLAESICSRYCDVLVDEYQDTNDLQNEIFNAVSNNGENLFTVGDVKQCIYNFRKANPINFLEKKNSYPVYDGTSEKSKIILSGNFRSSAKICAFVNYIFEKIMVESIAGMDYNDEDRLVPLGNFSEEDNGLVSFDVIDSTDSDRNDCVLQAEYIVNYIKNTVGKECISSNGVMRPVEYSDIFIMMRSLKNKTQDFVDTFKKAGIPVSSEVETGYFVLPEICMIINLLKVVNNPIKDISMLAVALSPIFAISPDEVANIRNNHKKISLYSAFEAEKDGNPRVAAMLDKIKLYRRWAASMSVSSLVSRILDDSMLTQIMLSTENGEIKKTNLLYFIEYAKSYEKNNFGGLSGFVNYIDRTTSSKRDINRKYTVGDLNSVKIMSIHGSKGLQAPICFIVNFSNEFNLRDCSNSVVLHPKYGIGLRAFNNVTRIKKTTLAREAVALAMKKDSVSEETRLLYVAMTRAQNRLIMLSVLDNAEEKIAKYSSKNTVSAAQIKQQKSYFDWAMSAISDCFKIGELKDNSAEFAFSDAYGYKFNLIKSDDIVEIMEGAVEEAEKEIIDYNEINEKLSFAYPNEKILGINSKYSVSGLAERETFERYYCTKKPSFMNTGGMSASMRGTLMHRFMEKCDFFKAEKSIEDEILRLTENGVFTEKESEYIDNSKIAAFFNGSVYALIKNADTVLREQRFIYEMSVNELDSSIESDEKVTVQGVADCVVIKDGKITVIDYKTDRVNEREELVSRYSAQLELYAKAMNNTYGLPVEDCLIYSFSLGKEISLGYSI